MEEILTQFFEIEYFLKNYHHAKTEFYAVNSVKKLLHRKIFFEQVTIFGNFWGFFFKTEVESSIEKQSERILLAEAATHYFL